MEVLDSVFDSLTRHSYLGLYGLIMACSLGFPFSKSVSILGAGILASNDVGNLFIYIIVGVAGLVTGDSIYFFLGYLGGDRALEFRYFSTPGFRDGLKRAELAFNKRDWWTVFSARFIPYFRNVVYLLAGLSRMLPHRFFIANILSAWILALAFCLAGYFLSEHQEQLIYYLKRVEGVVAIIGFVILVTLSFFFWKSRQNGTKRDNRRGNEPT